MEGNGHQQFVREVFAHPRQPVAAPTVEDNDLEIFTQDIPFNFVVEQALDKLEDPGVLAKVAQLQTLNACIPVFSELIQAVQELSNAMHKFHKAFNDKASHLVLQLEATKWRMEGARIQLRVQNALLELARAGDLRGRFYWSGLPGLLEHPNRHYLPSLCDACTITAQGSEVQNKQGTKKEGPCGSLSVDPWVTQ